MQGYSGPKPHAVALLGVPGAGKSIIARRLSVAHGFKRIRFTDPLREMLQAGFAVSGEEIDGEQREIAQDRLAGCSGQRLFRGLTYWSREMSGNLLPTEWKRRAMEAGGLILADDVQRENEAEAVWALGGIIVRIVRPGVTGSSAISERVSRICADLEIVNSSNRDGLIAQADVFAHELRAMFKAAA